jgi:hypothetical protein
MQAAQDSVRRTGIHRHDVRGCKFPAEIDFAMRYHVGNSARFRGVGPAQMCLCCLYIADIGKALGPQQF